MKLAFTVLYFNKPDRLGEMILAEGCEVPEHVTVSKDFQKGFQNRLGPAKLTKHPDRVVAEWQWPGGERLPCVALYPAVGGVVNDRDGKVIKSCKIQEIGISDKPNQDETILSIQEQNPTVPIRWEPGVTSLIKKTFMETETQADKVSEHKRSDVAHAEPPSPSGSD